MSAYGVNQRADHDRIGEIAQWLIAEARLSLAPLELIDRFCHRLVDLGVPLWRLRAGQRLANPLASAWGVIWTRDGSHTHEYVVARSTLSTGTGEPGGMAPWKPSAIGPRPDQRRCP